MTDSKPESGTCDYCSRTFSKRDLNTVHTQRNGVERKEWVCDECEGEARQYESPPVGVKE